MLERGEERAEDGTINFRWKAAKVGGSRDIHAPFKAQQDFGGLSLIAVVLLLLLLLLLSHKSFSLIHRHGPRRSEEQETIPAAGTSCSWRPDISLGAWL
jgi:hypothetical protein